MRARGLIATFATLHPSTLPVGVFVREDSDVHSLSDLKGKRVSSPGFHAQGTIGRIIAAPIWRQARECQA